MIHKRYGYTRHYNPDGKLHRTDGPAVISFDGRLREWYYDGLRHRTDGPAVVSCAPSGVIKEWWIFGCEVTENIFWEFSGLGEAAKETVKSLCVDRRLDAAEAVQAASLLV